MGEKKTGIVLISRDQEGSELLSAVQSMGGYHRVEIGYLADRSPSLGEAIDQVLSGGVQQVLLIATLTAGDSDQVESALAQVLAARQAAYPEVEFVHLPSSLDSEDHAQLLVHALQQVGEGEAAADAVPLTSLPAHEGGTIQRLDGGHEFISRLAALGFVPGSPVKVVQNYSVGPLIVTVQGTQIALGRAEARRVRVCPSGERRCRERVHGRQRRHWRRGQFE